MTDDTISRQMAIDVIDKIFPADPMRNDYTKGITCGAALAKTYVEQLPSAEPQWIPCSERLPEIKEHHVSDTVICYCSNGAYAFSQLQENIFGQCGFECERDDDYHEAVGEVVAWMPLQKPYKGD